jgi:phage repressor protein C with HTH and peptisase S24 domain
MRENDAAEFGRRIPVIGYAQAGRAGFFDDAGYPVGGGWDELDFPNLGDAHAYALEISGDSMEPVYRDGDIIIVSPQAGIRRGDRVAVKTRDEEVMAKQLVRQTAHRIDLMSINRAHGDISLPLEAVFWMSRIVWASQ